MRQRDMTAGSPRARLPKARHLAHLHLLSVVNTESVRFQPGQVVRILDAGCGAGQLIAYLAEALPILQPWLTYELYGFDIDDFPNRGFSETIAELSRRFPQTPWPERFQRIPEDAAWPYPDGYFDIIISEQVGEHLRDHARFFREIARCLDPGGFSVNLFPLKHVIMEWHLLIPFAHRVRNYDLLKSVIAAGSRLGLGKSRRAAKKALSLSEYAAERAEFVVKHTGYISYGELLSMTKRFGLLVSMRYSREFYSQKLRQLLARPPRYQYTRERSILADWLLVFLLRYLSSVTVVLEKGGRDRG
jgi:SAM-dependent methyltransferase